MEQKRGDAVVVKEVSVTDVGYTSGCSNSCIFQDCEADGNTCCNDGKFSGGHTTIVYGWFLLVEV
jgi:hypothetical protein